MHSLNIREIRPQDNAAIAQVIRDVLIEHDVPKIGTAYADPELDHMYEAYVVPNARYFVVELNGKIVGGAGVSKLSDGDNCICELQKMYFLK
ncbi:MAG TPA: GNAT family N-acetyltransferase, partial [Flavobacterium sp.]|nr:GNAT family N-acetyltransferase [Flavobacterium sp.]